MALTSQQRSWCVLEFHRTSIVTVQRAFKLKFNVDPPTNESILKWHRNFIERGYICDQRKGQSGQLLVSEQVVDHVRESILRSPRKSMCRASQELKVPQSTVNKILHKRLWLHPYRLQLVQKLHPEDKETWHAFCANLQALSGKVNRYNVRTWGSENPHATLEDEHNSPKLNVFCAVSKQTVYSPFIFEGQTITAQRYLEMLTNWLIPQLAAERRDYLFQQDGAPLHWHLAVCTFLNEHLPNRWIGHAGKNDQVFCKWPTRSPDLTVCVFFLWGYVKNRVYVPPLPATMSVTPDMLQRVWSKLDYHIDVCRVTRGGHIECVWYHMKLYEFMQL